MTNPGGMPGKINQAGIAGLSKGVQPMGLKAVIDSIDGLPEPVAELYVQSGDKFVLDIDDVDSHPTVSGLSNTVKAVRTEKKDLEKNFQELQAKIAGIDLDKIKDVDLDDYANQVAELKKLRDEKEQQQIQKLKDEKNWEKLEQQLTGEHTKKIESLNQSYSEQLEMLKQQLNETATKKDEEINSVMSALKENLKDKELTSELAKAKGNIPILMPHISPFVEVQKTEDGKFQAVVVDQNKNPRINNLGEPMTIAELVNEFKAKPEFSGEGLFAVEKKPGGSSSSGNRDTSSSEHNPFRKDTFNLTEQALLKRKDPQSYERLKAAAAAGED
jgi:hypothetical protein